MTDRHSLILDLISLPDLQIHTDLGFHGRTCRDSSVRGTDDPFGMMNYLRPIYDQLTQLERSRSISAPPGPRGTTNVELVLHPRGSLNSFRGVE